MAVDRAINFALRVTGIGELERDFKRAGGAGEKSFAQVEKAANGAAQEVSEYTARLRRVTEAAKGAFANIPQLNKGSAEHVTQNKSDFILEAVRGEQQAILGGLPETTGTFEAAAGGAQEFAASLTEVATLAAAAGFGLAQLGQFALDSLVAFQEHEAALDNFSATLALTGNRSTATGDEISAMAEKIVDATGQTEKSVLQAAAKLATVPGITKAGLESALTAAAQLADKLGVDVTEVIESEVIPAFQALTSGNLVDLKKATDDLSPPLQRAVLDLAKLGDTAAAQELLIQRLRDAVGDGNGGLTTATNQLDGAWQRLKLTLGENLAGPAAAGLNALSLILEGIQSRAAGAQSAIRALLGLNPVLGALGAGVFGALRRRSSEGPAFVAPSDGPSSLGRGRARQLMDARTEAEIERKYGEQPKPKRTPAGRRGGGGGGGKSDAEREAERLKREAETAGKAAERVREANAKVGDSYRLRAEEARARTGIEGEALEALERHLAGEAAVRKLSTETIEKEVAARRAAAAVAKSPFDEAAVTAEVTTAFEAQKVAVRDLAEAEFDAARALDDFNKRQSESKALLEQLKTPLERINDEVEQAITLLRKGNIGGDDFDKRMQQLAEDLADVRYELDEGAQAWRGFGQDVGRTLSSLVLDGGSAKDVLKQLIRLPVERLLEQQLTNPLADLIDGFTGNNRDKNVAAARGDLPQASRMAGAQVVFLGDSAERAAAALAGIPGVPPEAISVLADNGAAAADALGALIPITGQFGGALGQVLNQLLSSQGGGGGLFGAIIGAIGNSGSPVPRLAGSAAATIAANPGLFASGTDSLPVGREFWVGENGREKMLYHGGGRLSVASHQQSRNDAGSGPREIRVSISGARGNAEIQQMVMQGVRQGIAGYDRVVGDRVKDQLARRD